MATLPQAPNTPDPSLYGVNLLQIPQLEHYHEDAIVYAVFDNKDYHVPLKVLAQLVLIGGVELQIPDDVVRNTELDLATEAIILKIETEIQTRARSIDSINRILKDLGDLSKSLGEDVSTLKREMIAAGKTLTTLTTGQATADKLIKSIATTIVDNQKSVNAALSEIHENVSDVRTRLTTLERREPDTVIVRETIAPERFDELLSDSEHYTEVKTELNLHKEMLTGAEGTSINGRLTTLTETTTELRTALDTLRDETVLKEDFNNSIEVIALAHTTLEERVNTNKVSVDGAIEDLGKGLTELAESTVAKTEFETFVAQLDLDLDELEKSVASKVDLEELSARVKALEDEEPPEPEVFKPQFEFILQAVNGGFMETRIVRLSTKGYYYSNLAAYACWHADDEEPDPTGIDVTSQEHLAYTEVTHDLQVPVHPTLKNLTLVMVDTNNANLTWKVGTLTTPP